MVECGCYLMGVDIDDVGCWGYDDILNGAQWAELGSISEVFAIKGDDWCIGACRNVDKGSVGSDEDLELFDNFADFIDVLC